MGSTDDANEARHRAEIIGGANGMLLRRATTVRRAERHRVAIRQALSEALEQVAATVVWRIGRTHLPQHHGALRGAYARAPPRASAPSRTNKNNGNAHANATIMPSAT